VIGGGGMMMLREIADRFEEINDTWREEIPAQQSADLAELDGLLLEMDQLDATDEVDLLRGQIELLMDQIELVIGPVTVTDDDGAVDDI
jgi:hypothetical protein